MSNLILLTRLQSWNNVDIEVTEEDTKISNLNIKQDSEISTSGYCDILNNQLIAIFSNINKNFLSLNGKLIRLTSEINIEYHVAQFEDKESWFKIFDGKILIFEMAYINPHKPFILPDPFAYDEDFNTTNFAYHLANYIKKVKQNNGIILFSNNNESPLREE